MNDADMIRAGIRADKMARQAALNRMMAGVPLDDDGVNVRDQARHDYAVLERDGFVTRDGLPPEAHRAWRSAIAGVAHGNGWRVDTGVTATGTAWAGVNHADGPPDTAR